MAAADRRGHKFVTRAVKTAKLPVLAAALPLIAVALISGCKKTPGADVVATVNGHAIMGSDMDRMYQQQLGQAQAQGQQPSAEQADSLRLGVVKELIDEEIVEQPA